MSLGLTHPLGTMDTELETDTIEDEGVTRMTKQFYIGERAMFTKSGREVTVRELQGDGYEVVTDSGKAMYATEDGLQHLAPVGELSAARSTIAQQAGQIEVLVQWLGVVLDQVDYTAGACGPTEMVGACLPVEVIKHAREALEATK